MTLKINKTYLIVTLVLFIIEFLIAFNFKSGFIRYTFGDYLVVMLLYYFFKSFIRNHSFNIAIAVLCFAYFIEFLQLIKILDLLHLNNNALVNLILGNTFNISDLIAYTLGIITVLAIEIKLQYHD